MRHGCRAAGALLAVLVAASVAQADVVALKRSSAAIYPGPSLSQVFKNAVANSTILVKTDASTGQDMVDDTCLYFVNNFTKYQNRGAVQQVTSDEGSLWRFNLSVLPQFVGGKVNKAELQLYFTGGNSNATFGQVLWQDWVEGNKVGDYPGATPGASPAHPRGTNTGPDQNATGGTTPPLFSWGPTGNQLFSLVGDVSGLQYGGTYNFNYTGTPFSGDGSYDGHGCADITAIAQNWANGEANRGLYTQHGNRAFTFAEAGGAYEPVLFIDYTHNDKPSMIADLAVPSKDWFKLDLSWTAPDDVPSGTVASYDIRYSTTAFPAAGTQAQKDSWWAAATQVTDAPPPFAPGTPQTYTLQNLAANTAYSVVVRSIDATDLVSDMASASATTDAMDVSAPAAVTLVVAYSGPNHVVLNWAAPGDNADGVGLATAYDIRYSTSAINAGNFGAVTQVANPPVPAAQGTTQTVTITGLQSTRQYWFALKTRDEVPNWSALSNVPSPTTLAPDTQAPNAISDLMVTGVHIKSVYLKWTTPADNGTAGQAGYEIRYSATAPPANPTLAQREAWYSSAAVAANALVPGPSGSEVTIQLNNLTADTTYYFGVKSFDLAVPANTSPVSSQIVTGRTLKAIQPITITNPWIVNDRVADTRTVDTMGATFQKAYTPTGVVNPPNDEAKAINLYNNVKRRLYHWAGSPPNVDDATFNLNVFGWGLCGNHQSINATIARKIFGDANARYIFVNAPTPGGHNIVEVFYDGAWHLFDTMTTFYVYDSATQPRHILNHQEIAAYATNAVTVNASAEGRACPGYLLCGDDADWWYRACKNATIYNGTGGAAHSMDMDLSMGHSLKRTCESWASQFTSNSPTPPFHHEAAGDWKDTVNFPYWEPYEMLSAANSTIGIGYPKTYRRWANGTLEVRPDFRSTGYQATLLSSTNIRTYNDDFQTPDLRPAAVGTPAEVVFKVAAPFFMTDGSISGTFTRHDPGDVNKIYFSADGIGWVQIWSNSATGTTDLANLNIKGYVQARYEYYIKVQLQADGSAAEAGVSNLVINTTYEHNKGSMPYLDKGMNNLTLSCDNPTALATGGGALHVVYKWKEYDGTGWNVDKTFERYFDETATYPYTFSINVGGTKVPRTEYILLEVTEPPQPDTIDPAKIQNFRTTGKGSRSVNLAWTATGDDYQTGTADHYELRYRIGSTFTEANWAGASLVSGMSLPQAYGIAESKQVTGLTASTTYTFAIKAFDEANRSSILSDPVTVTTDPPDVTPPAKITTLSASSLGGTSGKARLSWTAPGDDGSTGTAAAYDIRYSKTAYPSDPAQFDSWFSAATQATGEPAPAVAGTVQTFDIDNLGTGAAYWFAMKTVDEEPLWSPISDPATCTPTLGQLTFQQGLNGYVGCTDTFISEASATGNYDAQNFLRITGFDTTNRQRTLIKFDLASIPTTATISRATLYLYCNGTGIQNDARGGNYAIHRTYERWTAAEATWTIAKNGTNWTIAGGGAFSGTPNGTAAKQTGAGWYAFDMTSSIQYLITNPDYNFGYIVKCEDETYHNQDQFWAASYASDTSLRPKLVITDVAGFNVQAINSPTAGGTVSGGGSYASGSTCTLTASPNTGLHFVFDHWQGGSISGSTANPVSFAVTADTTVTAVFRCTDTGFIEVSTYAELVSAMTTATAGQTIRVHPGTYTMTTVGGKIVAGNSGTASQPIKVIGISDGSGNRPLLTASVNIQRFFEFEPTDNYWTVENLEFRHCRASDYVGTSVYIRGDNFTLRNCKVSDCDFGIFPIIDADNCLIENCEVANGGTVNHPSYGHLIYFQANSGTIRGCYLHNESGYGMSLKTRSNNCVVEYNWIGPEGPNGTGDYVCNVASRNTQNQLWRGNVIVKQGSRVTGTQRALMSFYDGSAESLSGTVTLINNTFVSVDAADIFLYQVASGAASDTATVVLKNNIFAGPAGTFLNTGVPASQLNGNNNVVISGLTLPASLTSTTFVSNPPFVDAAGGDYHLQSTSPCKNVGQNGATYLNASGQWVNGVPTGEPTRTLSITPRATDATIDAGAFEYGGAAPVQVAFNAASSNGSETVTNVNIPVSLTAAAGSQVTVQYAVTGGSATGSGTDYTLAAGTLTFDVGVTSQNIAVTINNDGSDEDDETIDVTLSNPTGGATLGATTVHAYTINDDDAAPTVQFAAASSSGPEATASTNLLVTLSAASGQAVCVNYSVNASSTAAAGDYTLTGTSLTFNPGQTSLAIPLTINNDGTYEPDETVVVDLEACTNATLGATTRHTYTIVNDDTAPLPVVQFQVTSSSAPEATSPANLVVTLDHTYTSDVTVQYAATGTATLGSDYTLPSGAPTSGVIALKRDGGLVSGGALDARFASASVVTTTVRDARIWNQGSAFWMNYGAASTVESYYAGTYGLFYWDLSAYAGATINKAQIRIKAIQGNTTGLWYAGIKTTAWAEGTGGDAGAYPGATPGVCWNHPNGTYTGPSGAPGWGASANAAFNDAADTGDVYTHYAFSSEPVGLDLLVADVTTLVQDWASGTKPNYGLVAWTGNHGLYACEAGTNDQPVLFVDYATAGVSNTITIPAGQTSATLPITILNESTIEPDETVIVTLSNPTQATLGANTTHTYTILNDDNVLQVQFSTAASSNLESVTPVQLTVALTSPAAGDVTVNYEVTGGTATAGPDFSLASGFGTPGVKALKRNTTLTAGGALSAQFTALTGSDVIPTTVADAELWNKTSARYQNFGTQTMCPGGTDYYLIMKWDLGSYARSVINKAELRVRANNGNDTMSWVGVKSHDWSEGNKNGNYPGAAPSAPGVTVANPAGTNTGNSAPLGWGAASNAMMDFTSNGADLYAFTNFTSYPTGVAWCVTDVTSLVQDWVGSVKPNYGLLVKPGNHGVFLSEQGAADQPVLFADYVLQKGTLTIPAGQTTRTIDLTIANDTAVEPNETISVTLSAPSGAVLGSNAVHTYTITNND